MPKRRPDHVPMRTCVVCRLVRPKRSMTRVVRGTDGTVSVDRSGKLAGRGTYVCDDPTCRDAQRLAQAVTRAFGVPVAAGSLELEVADATA